MTHNRSTTQPNEPVSPVKSTLIGAGIGLTLIAFFISGVDKPHPEWPELWYIRPLIMTTITGAMGGAFWYFMDFLSCRGMNKTTAVVLGLIVFLIALWLGAVLGLDGTMWD